MEKQVICHWKYCREKLTVDSSIEESISWVNVVGWCPFHQKVFGKQHELFSKLDKNISGSTMANKLWQTNRKKYLSIQKKAIAKVKLLA